MSSLLAARRQPVTRLFPLWVFFVADGVLFASWVVRIPQIKEQVGASATELGFALLCMTLGSAVSMYAAGGICERLGTRTVMVALFPLVGLGLVLPALTGSPVELGAVLLVLGGTYGVLLVALNAAAVEIESATGRAIMSPMHGLWSVGGLVGAVIGGLVATHLSTLAHLGLVAIFAVVVTAAAGPVLLRGPRTVAGLSSTAAHDPGADPSPVADPSTAGASASVGRSAVKTGVLLFGIVALCTAYGEGAVGDWAALHLRHELGTTASVAAYGFGAYSVAVAVGRLTGGWILGRVGETSVLTGGAVLAAVGVLAAAWTTDLAVAFAGLVVVGLGLANMFPVAMARAGALGGARGVGLASTIGTTGMLAGPPVIGFLADQLGLPAALSTVAVLAMVAAGLALVLRRIARSADRAGSANLDSEVTSTPAT